MGKVLHMIANAHVDPVWLWRWPAAVDEIIATCRTACDLLDEYREFVFTRGEAWCYEQIREHDPELFKRIRRYVEMGRWQPVNGWWVQPDCNFPTSDSFRMQAEVGRKWFRDNLGVDVTVGYNVDSFGHCATLPRFLREAGMDAYTFMRPGPIEKSLPAELFTWEAPSGENVAACRIFGSYNDHGPQRLHEKVSRIIEKTEEASEHVMCFFGIGDHGGGPTRTDIEWILQNLKLSGDVELRFSHPRAFFDAVAELQKPLVKGELQFHAIGCYSALHEIKQEMRRSESLLAQAGSLIAVGPAGDRPVLTHRLLHAWRRVLFNQSHDCLGGTAVRSAYEHTRDELGEAKAAARDIIVALNQKAMRGLADCAEPRIVLTNPAEASFSGYLEIEPWLGYFDWSRSFSLVDESGGSVPLQRVASEAALTGGVRILIRAKVPARGRTVLRVHLGDEEKPARGVWATADGLGNEIVSASVDLCGVAEIRRNLDPAAAGIRLAAFKDESDTWSHGLRRFPVEEERVFTASAPWTIIERGPLRATLSNMLRLGPSSLIWRIMVGSGEPGIRMHLRLHWIGERTVVKLLIPAAFPVTRRIDGCPGGLIERQLDGNEYPEHDLVALEGKDRCLTVVSPDYFSADVQANGTIRATLLRSPFFAHEQPLESPSVHYFPLSGQGEHEYDIDLLALDGFDGKACVDVAVRKNTTIWVSECTHGMPARS